MPNRDYYLVDSPRMEAIRTAYKTHLANVPEAFRRAGRRGPRR